VLLEKAPYSSLGLSRRAHRCGQAPAAGNGDRIYTVDACAETESKLRACSSVVLTVPPAVRQNPTPRPIVDGQRLYRVAEDIARFNGVFVVVDI
jgi:hypothetical protein